MAKPQKSDILKKELDGWGFFSVDSPDHIRLVHRVTGLLRRERERWHVRIDPERRTRTPLTWLLVLAYLSLLFLPVACSTLHAFGVAASDLGEVAHASAEARKALDQVFALAVGFFFARRQL